MQKDHLSLTSKSSTAKLKEFELRLKFEMQLKYGCSKISAGAQLKPAFGGFETGLKFIKFRISSFDLGN